MKANESNKKFDWIDVNARVNIAVALTIIAILLLYIAFLK